MSVHAQQAKIQVKSASGACIASASSYDYVSDWQKSCRLHLGPRRARAGSGRHLRNTG